MKIGVTMYETSFPAAYFRMKVPSYRAYPLTDVLIKNHVTPLLLATVSPTTNVINKIFRSVDGLILGGGDDITPAMYHERPLVPGLNYPIRDRFETALIHGALKFHKPVLGICRGNQMINVALGGTLYQNIYRQLSVPLLDHTNGFHRVRIRRDSSLYQVLGPRPWVNSRHHQAIDKLGRGLRVVARSSDGIVEGVESTKALFQGVQWHPENLWKRYRPEENLFRAFVKRVGRSKHFNGGGSN